MARRSTSLSGAAWMRILPASSELRMASGVNRRRASTDGTFAACVPAAVSWHEAQLARKAASPSCAVASTARATMSAPTPSTARAPLLICMAAV